VGESRQPGRRGPSALGRGEHGARTPLRQGDGHAELSQAAAVNGTGGAQVDAAEAGLVGREIDQSGPDRPGGRAVIAGGLSQPGPQVAGVQPRRHRIGPASWSHGVGDSARLLDATPGEQCLGGDEGGHPGLRDQSLAAQLGRQTTAAGFDG